MICTLASSQLAAFYFNGHKANGTGKLEWARQLTRLICSEEKWSRKEIHSAEEAVSKDCVSVCVFLPLPVCMFVYFTISKLQVAFLITKSHHHKCQLLIQIIHKSMNNHEPWYLKLISTLAGNVFLPGISESFICQPKHKAKESI